MVDKEKAKLIKDIRAYVQKVAASEDEAKKLLAKTGMYTASGNLKSTYK